MANNSAEEMKNGAVIKVNKNVKGSEGKIKFEINWKTRCMGFLDSKEDSVAYVKKLIGEDKEIKIFFVDENNVTTEIKE